MKEINKDMKRNPFKVPENYFEELEGRILLATSEKPVAAKVRGIAMIRPWLSLAAIIAGVAVLTMAVLHFTEKGNVTANGSNTAYADVPQFLIDGIDMYLIDMQMLGEAGTEKPADDINYEDIMEYLMLSEVDFAVLYEHLDDKIQL